MSCTELLLRVLVAQLMHHQSQRSFADRLLINYVQAKFYSFH